MPKSTIQQDMDNTVIRRRFQERYPDPVKATETDVAIFYGWLEQHWRGLAPAGGYKMLREPLKGLFTPNP